jgi:hypothetical protein
MEINRILTSTQAILPCKLEEDQREASDMIREFMEQPSLFIREGLKTPRAAATAGILSSVLLTTTLVLLRISVTAASQEVEVSLAPRAGTVLLVLNLVPFAGIAFLWFIGVVRDRFVAYEDRFFSTVFIYPHPKSARSKLWRHYKPDGKRLLRGTP